jgi:hypothetical protein
MGNEKRGDTSGGKYQPSLLLTQRPRQHHRIFPPFADCLSATMAQNARPHPQAFLDIRPQTERKRRWNLHFQVGSRGEYLRAAIDIPPFQERIEVARLLVAHPVLERIERVNQKAKPVPSAVHLVSEIGALDSTHPVFKKKRRGYGGRFGDMG